MIAQLCRRCHADVKKAVHNSLPPLQPLKVLLDISKPRSRRELKVRTRLLLHLTSDFTGLDAIVKKAAQFGQILDVIQSAMAAFVC